MAAITTQEIGLASMTPTYAAAGGPDTFTPGDRSFLHFKNTNGSARTVTITTHNTVNGLAVADVAVTLDATTGDEMVGPLFPRVFADPTDGLGDIAYSATAGVTVACLNLA